MNQVYSRFISREEQRRVARVEIFDELEEWHLIQGHYAITVAVRESCSSSSSSSSSFCNMPFLALARELGECVEDGGGETVAVGSKVAEAHTHK